MSEQADAWSRCRNGCDTSSPAARYAAEHARTRREDLEAGARTSRKIPDRVRQGFAARVTPLEGGRVEHVISTEAIDRHGSTIAAGGWELDNYRKNPIVLFAHDSSAPPVGRAVEVRVDPERRALVAVTEFTPRDVNPFGDMVGRMVREGFMPAVSVGFIALDYVIAEDRDDGSSWVPPIDYKRQELAEYSIVPVPSNPEALARARSAGIDTRPMCEWAEKVLAGEFGDGLWLSQKQLERLARPPGSEKLISIPAPAPSPASKPTTVTLDQIREWTAEAVEHAVQSQRMARTGKID